MLYVYIYDCLDSIGFKEKSDCRLSIINANNVGGHAEIVNPGLWLSQYAPSKSV